MGCAIASIAIAFIISAKRPKKQLQQRGGQRVTCLGLRTGLTRSENSERKAFGNAID